ncbi:MAG: peptidase M14 family protein, partial [Thermoanaerobaculia bacterium]
VASMDEGWTRWLLERYEFPFVNLSNEKIRDGSFANEIDTLLLPDVGRPIIESGKPDDPRRASFWSPLPPEYDGGLGDEGGEAIARWIRDGGTAVAMDSSTEYLIRLLELPVANVLDDVAGDRFSAPGTMMRILVDTEHPLGFGMRSEEAAYFAGSPAFRTRVPDARFDRHVVARYPDHRDDIPISGYVRGAELLERRAAVVEVKVGEGRVVLIGFRPQHRAQPHRTFKLLFNALFLAGLEQTEL